MLFTGNNEDEYNSLPEKITKVAGRKVRVEGKRLTKHWMAIYGNLLFDSYGYQDDYKINKEMFKPVRTHPTRLQQFDSDVCGAYVLSFLHFCNKNASNTSDNKIGHEYTDFFDFSDDRSQNDKTVLKWYADMQ